MQIKDQTWYADMGSEGAIEFHFFSDEEKEYSKPEWDAMRFGMVCTSTDTFAENKKIILKLCTDNPRCSFEEKKALESFFSKIESLGGQ